MSGYENKKIADIQSDVEEKFEQIDRSFSRDDAEIYQAGLELSYKYKEELGVLKEDIDACAVEQLHDRRLQLEDELRTTYESFSGYAYFTNNRAVIQEVAHKIDNAENEVLEMHATLQRKQQAQTAIIEQVDEEQADYFSLNEDGSFTLSAACNRPRIDQVLGDMVRPDQVWLIDYCNCTNSRIATKMEQAIGGKRCFLSYGVDRYGHQTYILRNREGDQLDQRALIREGVKLTPDAAVQFAGQQHVDQQEQSQAEQLRQQSSIGEKKLEQLQSDPHWSTIIAEIPDELKEQLTSAENASTYKEFLEKSEQRLDEIIIYAKEHGRELHTQPISKLTWAWGGMMEVHLISGSAEKDLKFLDYEDDQLSDDLRDILDGNESDYKTFLTKRIKAKWQQYAFMTKQEAIVTTPEDTEQESGIDQERKDNVRYALGLFEKMIDSLRASEGDSRDDDDHQFVQMQQFVSNADYTIRTQQLTAQQMQSLADQLAELFRAYRDESGGSVITREEVGSACNRLFGNDKQQAIAAIRQLGESTTVLGNTHTSFLQEELDDDLQLDDADMQELYENIGTRLDVENQATHVLLSKLYTAEDATSSENGSVKSLLRTHKILPPKGTIREKKINKLCVRIHKNIQSMRKQIQAEQPTEETLWQDMLEQQAALMAKPTKTEEDLVMLQTIEIYKEDTQLRDQVLGGQIEQLTSEIVAYAQIEDIVRGGVTPLLVREAHGSDSEIYDDIVGAGEVWEFWEWSDQNAAMVGEMLKMIAEEAVFMVVASLLVASGVGAGAGAALMAARVGRLGAKIGKLTKLSKIFGAIKNSPKFTSLVAKARNSRLVHSRLGAFAGRHSSEVVGGMNKGLTHVLLQKTYNGEYDHSFKQWTVDFLQRTAMYSVLGVVGKSAESGRIARRFTSTEGNLTKVNMTKARWTSFALEELGMQPADFAIEMSFNGQMLSKEEIINNIAMGLLFEFVPGVKSIVMGKVWKVNGEVKTRQEVEKMLEENKQTIQEQIDAQFDQRNSPEYQQLRDQMVRQEVTTGRSRERWLSQAEQFESQLLDGQIALREIDESLLPAELIVLRDAASFDELSPEQIRAVQKLIGTTPDSYRGDLSLAALGAYLQPLRQRSQALAEAKKQLSRQDFRSGLQQKTITVGGETYYVYLDKRAGVELRAGGKDGKLIEGNAKAALMKQAYDERIKQYADELLEVDADLDSEADTALESDEDTGDIADLDGGRAYQGQHSRPDRLEVYRQFVDGMRQLLKPRNRVTIDGRKYQYIGMKEEGAEFRPVVDGKVDSAGEPVYFRSFGEMEGRVNRGSRANQQARQTTYAELLAQERRGTQPSAAQEVRQTYQPGDRVERDLTDPEKSRGLDRLPADEAEAKATVDDLSTKVDQAEQMLESGKLSYARWRVLYQQMSSYLTRLARKFTDLVSLQSLRERVRRLQYRQLTKRGFTEQFAPEVKQLATHIGIDAKHLSPGTVVDVHYPMQGDLPMESYKILILDNGFEIVSGTFTFDYRQFHAKALTRKSTRQEVVRRGRSDGQFAVMSSVDLPNRQVNIKGWNVGDEVFIPRNDGSSSRGEIVDVDPVDGTVTTMWREGDLVYTKKLLFAEVDEFNLSPQELTEMAGRISALRRRFEAALDGQTDAKLREKLEAGIETLDKIASGEVTLDTYKGIRSIKGVDLDIEQDMLPLTRKVIENTKHKYPHQPEKWEITRLIDVDRTLEHQLEFETTTQLFDETIGPEKLQTLQEIGFPIPEHFVVYKQGDEAFNRQVYHAKQYIDGIKDGSFITPQEKQTLLLASAKFIDYAQGAGLQLSDQQLYELVQDNIKKLVYQDVSDRMYLAGSDHGILHVVNGDMFGAIRIMEGLGDQITPKEKMMMMQMIVDHDLGYTLNSFDDMLGVHIDMFFSGTKDHPLYSRVYVDALEDQYRAIYGDDYEMMRVAMLDHSDVHTTDIHGLAQGSDRQALLQAIIAGVDCLGVTHVDKTPALFLHYPEMMGFLQRAHDLQKMMESTSLTKEQKEHLAGRIKKDMIEFLEAMDIDPKQRAAFVNSLKKTFDPLNVGFPVKFNFSSYCYSFVGVETQPGGMRVEMDLNAEMFDATVSGLGSKVALNNMMKAMGDFSLGKDTQVEIGGSTYKLEDLYVNQEKPTKIYDDTKLLEAIDQLENGESIVFTTGRPTPAEFVFTKRRPGQNIDLAEDIIAAQVLKEQYTGYMRELESYRSQPDQYIERALRLVKDEQLRKELLGMGQVEQIDDQLHERIQLEVLGSYGLEFNEDVLELADAA